MLEVDFHEDALVADLLGLRSHGHHGGGGIGHPGDHHQLQMRLTTTMKRVVRLPRISHPVLVLRMS